MLSFFEPKATFTLKEHRVRNWTSQKLIKSQEKKLNVYLPPLITANILGHVRFMLWFEWSSGVVV